MKVTLYDIENYMSPAALTEAMELARETQEYTITQPEDGFYHVVSKRPDFHVEIGIKPDGMVTARCQCMVFKKQKQCKHAWAALILLRDYMLRSRKGKSRSRQDAQVTEDVLRKISITELRHFIATYAQSHSSFRTELLAHYLHLLKKPDYHHLLSEMTPMDKYGNIKLNRNTLKSVRNILSTLLRQAQQLLRDKELPETFQILEACLLYLHRLLIKAPRFQEQLNTELRLALRLFDALCHHPMAPRLQQAAITLVTDLASREGYTFLKGSRPLLLSIEPFILESKTRQSTFNLAEKKTLQDTTQQITWACLLMRWSRLWGMKPGGKELRVLLQNKWPDIIHEFHRQGEHEDVLFTFKSSEGQTANPAERKRVLQEALKAAQLTGDLNAMANMAYELSISHLDAEAWDVLMESHTDQAFRALDRVAEFYGSDTDPQAEYLLLHGYQAMGRKKELLQWLQKTGDATKLVQYDAILKAEYRPQLTVLYARYIHETREAFGGVIARQKLSNIFGHLKSIDLYTEVAEKIKHMDSTAKGGHGAATEIRGFVFDLDGVIVDTAIHHFQSWKTVMHTLGAEITEEDDLHTRGASRMESLEYLIQRYGIQLTPEEKDMWAASKNDIYLEAIEQITPRDLLPGALPFLIDSRKMGLKLALGSASKNARGVLKKLGIEDRFDAILDGHDAKESKPHPEIFIKATQALGLEPHEVVVFEDAAKGVQAAVSAGCKVVGLGDPNTLAQADIVIHGLDETTPAQIIEQLS